LDSLGFQHRSQTLNLHQQKPRKERDRKKEENLPGLTRARGRLSTQNTTTTTAPRGERAKSALLSFALLRFLQICSKRERERFEELLGEFTIQTGKN